MKKTRSIQVIKDLDGKNIVMINDVIFKGKRHINWRDVEEYLKRYIGEFYKIAETKDIIYIGKDLPDEYAHSKYTYSLNKMNAKVKANIVQAIPKLIEIATNKSYKENIKHKHLYDAKEGWYRYDTRFAFPKYDNFGEIITYSLYKAVLIIRRSADDKYYLYDIIQISKLNK